MSAPDSEMDALHRRATKAWEVAALHHGSLREAYRWYMPRRYQEMQASGKEGNDTLLSLLADLRARANL